MLHRETYAGTWYYGKEKGSRQKKNPEVFNDN
jgi:hypothetical protein